MIFFTSQRPGLWILIVSCFFSCFFCVPFSWFFLVFFAAVFPLLFHYLWMLFFVLPFVFFWLPCLVWCVATLLQPRFFTITTKHVCKAFLQEYRIRDIRFRVLWSKQDPNAKGEKRPRKKYEKITQKKWEKKLDLLKPALKKNKNLENQEKPRVCCVFLRFSCVFFAFFLRFFCVLFAFFLCFFCVFFVFFLLFFSPLPRGRCFCARRPWRPKSLM